MVRRIVDNRIRGWKVRGCKESLAAFVAAGAVAWHIMACVESPMSFSPTGDLAFVVMDPYPEMKSDTGDFVLTGKSVNRLMVLTKDKKLSEIERTSSQMITAPAYSPDGRELAYLRLPLLSQEDTSRIDEFIKKRRTLLDQATAGSTAQKWIFVAPEGSTPALPQNDSGDVLTNLTDLTLPPSAQSIGALSLASGGGLISAELVVRSAATGELVRSIPLNIPLGYSDDPSDVVQATYQFSYLLTRPQYSSEGEWLYFSLGGLSLAVSPSTGEKHLLSLSAEPALEVLSPDGMTLAILSEESLSLRSTDGKRTVFVRLQHEPFPWSGMAWTGNKTVAVLGQDLAVDLYDTDGHLLRSSALPPESVKKNDPAELAVSPNGEYMAISQWTRVQFLTSDGTALGSWQQETDDEVLVQPTFTPDSRQVAFKLMETVETNGEKGLVTVAIVFFTPEGQEIFRVPIPRAPRGKAAEPPKPGTEGAQ